MVLEPEEVAARAVEPVLGVKFGRSRRSLGEWGKVDNCAGLGDGRTIILEVEASQKHPCTNVLKLWPYLDENPTARVMLVQVFYKTSPGLRSSRGRLGIWLGERMEREFEGRFQYCRIVLRSDGSFFEGVDQLKLSIRGGADFDRRGVGGRSRARR